MFDLRIQRTALALTIGTSLLAASSHAFAQAKDELWEVSMKMEVAGMPMAMPPQIHRVCIGKAHKDEDMIPVRDNCRVLEARRTGNKIAYRMACAGDQPMDVTGETTYTNDGYEGRMRMTSTSPSQSMEMAQSYVGRRVGECTATK